MKIPLKALRRRPVERLIIESVDLSLYIAHAVIDGQQHLIAGDNGKALKTVNLLAMKQALRSINAGECVLLQRSAYDEMVGLRYPPADNALELPLGPGYESLPDWLN